MTQPTVMAQNRKAKICTKWLIFIWGGGYSPRSLEHGSPPVGSRGRSPGRRSGAKSPEAEAVFRYCLQILTLETIRMWWFRTIHPIILDQYVSQLGAKRHVWGLAHAWCRRHCWRILSVVAELHQDVSGQLTGRNPSALVAVLSHVNVVVNVFLFLFSSLSFFSNNLNNYFYLMISDFSYKKLLRGTSSSKKVRSENVKTTTISFIRPDC